MYLWVNFIPVFLSLSNSVPSGPPTNFVVSQVLTTSVSLKWGPPLAEERNGIIIGYDVNVSHDDTQLLVKMTADNQITIGSLEPQRTYFFIVAAKTSVGRGPFSTEVSATTAPEGECTQSMLTVQQFFACEKMLVILKYKQ